MNDEQFLEGISNTTHRQNGGTVHMCGLLVIIRQDGSASLVEAPKQRVDRAWRTVGSAHGQASKDQRMRNVLEAQTHLPMLQTLTPHCILSDLSHSGSRGTSFASIELFFLHEAV